MRRFLATFALLCALPAAAETESPLGPDDFREFSEGYTLYYSEDGRDAGSESFGPDGKVTWRSPEGTCIEGLWRPRGQDLCFFYGTPDVECWRLLRDDQGLKVRLNPDDGADEIITFRIVRRDHQPLLCGPGIGI